MTKAEFIAFLAQELNESKTKTSQILEIVFNSIAKTMKDNDELQLTGFGTFRAKHYSAREVKTPFSGLVKVSPKRRASFTMGKNFKDTLEIQKAL